MCILFKLGSGAMWLIKTDLNFDMEKITQETARDAKIFHRASLAFIFMRKNN